MTKIVISLVFETVATRISCEIRFPREAKKYEFCGKKPSFT